MRIASVTTSWPRHAEDYAGRFVFDLHAALEAAGHELITLAPAALSAPAEEEGKAGLVLRLGKTDGSCFYADGMEANLRRNPGVAWSLRKFLGLAKTELSRLTYDLGLAHWVLPSALAFPRKRGIPLMGVMHGGDAHWLGRPIGSGLLRRIFLSRCDAVAFTSARNQARFEAYARSHPTRLVRMGSPAEIGVSPDAELPPEFVLGVGRLDRLKGFDDLIRALEGQDLPLVLVGDGIERTGLESLAKSLSVTLRFLGVQPSSVVRGIMAAARLVVIPSRRHPSGREEGTPLVLMEALHAGIPILGSRTGGIPEVLPESHTFPSGDVQALAALILQARQGQIPALSTELAWTPERSAKELLQLASEVIAS